MKNNQGVSIITLIITIVIIIILATIFWISGIGSVNETNKTKLNVEVGNLKQAVASRLAENARNPERYPLVGNRIDKTSATNYINNIRELSNFEVGAITARMDENMESFRLVDASGAAVLGVDGVDKEHKFIIDYSTGDVYGFVDRGE